LLKAKQAIKIVRVGIGKRGNDKTIFQINYFINPCGLPFRQPAINREKFLPTKFAAVKPLPVDETKVWRLPPCCLCETRSAEEKAGNKAA
jgi:hypothetical protein